MWLDQRELGVQQKNGSNSIPSENVCRKAPEESVSRSVSILRLIFVSLVQFDSML
jgi:hypothetical protein